MLELKLTRTGINATGTEMYLSDGTGDYDVDNNPGGWGDLNPTRAQRALLIQAFYKKSDADEDVEVLPYDPETVSNFTLKCNNDGYHDILMIAVPNTNPTVEGEYGWSLTNGLTKLTDGVLVPTTVREVYDDELYLESVSFKTVLLARLAIYRNTKNLELVNLRMVNNDDRAHVRELSEAQNHFNFVRCLLEGARYQWCMDNYTESQRIVESFNELIDE